MWRNDGRCAGRRRGKSDVCGGEEKNGETAAPEGEGPIPVSTHRRAPVHRRTAARHYIMPVKDLQSYTSQHTHARSCTQAHCRTSLQYTSEGPIVLYQSAHTRALLYTGTLPHVTTVYQWRTYSPIPVSTHTRAPVHRHIAARHYSIPVKDL